jgi:AMP-binding enzyme C-terminal domain
MGRGDDMTNCGGENVYPKEVETILLQHPALTDARVVSAPHEVKGEATVAFRDPRAGCPDWAGAEAVFPEAWTGLRPPATDLLPGEPPLERNWRAGSPGAGLSRTGANDGRTARCYPVTSASSLARLLC